MPKLNPVLPAKPQLIYGTAWKKENTALRVEQAVLSGFRAIDTACQPKHYNEAGVGEALGRLHGKGITRSEIYLQTKFTPVDGQDPLRIPYDPRAELKTQVAQSFQSTQKNLKSTYVDSLVLHSPLSDTRDFLEVWQAMENIAEDGGARELGLSNCYSLDVLQWLYTQARIKPTVLQNRFYRETGYDHDIRIWCNAHAIRYQSFWTLTANPQILSHPLLVSLAGLYEKTTAQIFFRFLIQIGISPLSGTNSELHMEEDLAIVSFHFNDEEVNAVSQLLI